MRRFLLALSILAVAAFVVDHGMDVKLRVVDEDGKPIGGATAVVGFEKMQVSGMGTDATVKRGLTNDNGEFSASGHALNRYISYGAEKSGYYDTHSLKWAGIEHPEVAGPPLLTVTLKRIVNPIAMYARSFRLLEIPAVDQAVGYDLEVGDWVAPHGKGIEGDFRFTVSRRFVSRDDYDATLTVTFPNQGDGLSPIRVTEPYRGSALRLPHRAPTDGYQPSLKQTLSRGPHRFSSTVQKDMNYFFRVRTKLDAHGHVVAAQYGKIHGDLDIDLINSQTCTFRFDYYFNPGVNDINVEFDPKMNLFHDARSWEVVRDP